jgi:Do/DeqQ family serine protease
VASRYGGSWKPGIIHGAGEPAQRETPLSSTQIQKGLIFLAGAAIGGLALAFVLVVIRPELLPGVTVNRTAAPLSVDERAAPGAANGAANIEVAADATGGAPAGGASNPTGSYAAAVQRAAPAVVNISARRVVTERLPRNLFDELFDDPFAPSAPRTRQRVESSLGSGVIISDTGQIVTNHHVIADADAIRVQLADGREADARIVGRDPDTDLALLRIDLRNLPVMPLGRSDALRVGDVVLAIGYPVGLSQTVTQGIVSATGRGQLGIATFENFIQTDAPINFGNSGGALVNTRGELVGINTAILAKNAGIEGIGFAIPVNLARGVIAEFTARGRVIRGWVGLAAVNLDDARAQAWGLPRGGVMIGKTDPEGPAQSNGLRPFDFILSIDGRAVQSAQDVHARIAIAKPGSTLEFEVQRGNERGRVKLRVTEQPGAARATKTAV